MLPLPPPPTFPLCVGICGSWAGPCPWVPHGAPARSAAPPPPPELLALFSANRLTPRPLFSLLQDSHLARAPPFATASGVCGPLFPLQLASRPPRRQPGCAARPSPSQTLCSRRWLRAGHRPARKAQRSPSARPARAGPSPILSPSLAPSASRRAGRPTLGGRNC